MRAVDDAVLTILRGIGGLDVWDGFMLPDPVTTSEYNTGGRKVVPYDVPYLVYYSSIGDLAGRRLSGRRTRQAVYFSVNSVGLDRNQVKWAGEKARGVLEGHRIPVAGHQSWLCSLEVSTRIFRDDDAIRPDGSPLFYGRDDYALSVTITPTGAIA